VAYQVKVGRRVRKEMARIPGQDQARILAALRKLAEEPRPAGCVPVKVAESGTYRVRVGDYRVIYTVLDDERVIIVARVSRRKESTYRGLR
jgi:mRNA interferase RelE/StbE